MFKKIRNKEIFFMTAGVLLFLAIGGGIIYSINFLVVNLKAGFEISQSQNPSVASFNLRALKDIGIIKE